MDVRKGAVLELPENAAIVAVYIGMIYDRFYYVVPIE